VPRERTLRVENCSSIVFLKKIKLSKFSRNEKVATLSGEALKMWE
jgi:hypothetical protein